MRDPGCRRCPLHSTSKFTCVWGEGTAASGVMLVGEAPGEAEDNLGRPFVGDAGHALNDLLIQVGLRREDVYVTNVAKCRPPGNRRPDFSEIARCYPYLGGEIDVVRPKVIVALGNTALTALTGLTGVSSQRGEALRVEGLIAPVVPTFHPASTLYRDSYQTRASILQDLRMAKSIASGPVGDHDSVIVLPVEYPDAPVRAAEPLIGCRTVAVDLEWTASVSGKAGDGGGKMVWPWANRGGEVYSLSLCGIVDGRYRSVTFGWPVRPDDFDDIQRILRESRVVFHNAVADLPWLLQIGFRGINLAADTMVLAHLLDENQMLNLEAVSARYGDVPGGWKGVLYNQRPRSRADWVRLLEYNGTDTYATLKALRGQASAITALGDRAKRVRALHSRLMIPGIRALVQASVVGVPVDIPAMQEAMTRIEAERDEFAVTLAEQAHITPAQAAKLAASPQQTVDYLRVNLGLPINSSKATELVDFSGHPEVGNIIGWRKKHKLASTYLKPWLGLLAKQGTNRLHTQYKPTGTRTGRFSAEGEKGGTLHTTPREKWVRALIKADPGRLIVAADYSQIELRVLAWVAQEATMIAAFRNGEDLHRTTAAFILATGERGSPPPLAEFWKERHLWVDKVTPQQRFDAKAVNFGFAYGMQPPKFQTTARQEYGVDVTLEQAREMHRAYFALYSRLAPWHAEIMNFARRQGAVSTPFGRWLSIDSSNLHVALNTPIQSVASDLTVLAMGYAFERFRAEKIRANIIGFVHDSIMLDAHEDDAERAGDILSSIMENLDTSPFGFTIPLPLVADVSIGPIWA